MQKVLSGVKKFRSEVFPGESELFERLAEGQHPEALFITCSDSRVVPNLITQTKPGDIFITRNAGNIVPAYSDVTSGVTATIEYAVLALEVSDIILCGHSQCGAMKALLHPELLDSLPSMKAWLRHADSARNIARENYSDLPQQELMEVVTEQNVLAQLGNLRTHPSVAARLQRGRLHLHGWVYDIRSGEIRAYSAEEGRFVPLAETHSGVEVESGRVA